ncbi:MAG: hypothetical protein OHK0032_06530 [Thermodesulfovibrionales bacterium]
MDITSGVKIYGLCLERLRHQIDIARSRIEKGLQRDATKVVLECYNTGNVDDIIDILELYDIGDDKRIDTLKGKLDELAYTASLLVRDKVEFGFNEDGELCLYLVNDEITTI